MLWVCDIEVEDDVCQPVRAKANSPWREPWEEGQIGQPRRGRKIHPGLRVQLRGASFRPCRGWRFGDGSPSLTRWATIWRPCRGSLSSPQRF